MKRATTSFLVASSLIMVSSFKGMPSTPDTVVYDKDIRVIDFEDLTYPTAAHTINAQGVVVVRVILDDQGKVNDATGISGAGLLIRACLENVRKWRFEPNSQKSAVVVYNFRIRGACHSDKDSSQFVFYPPNFASITGCTHTLQP